MWYPGVAAARWSSWSGGLTLSAAALVLALGGGEVVARLTRLDQKLMTPVLYFQAADLPVHRISTDPVLHYELAPETRCHCELAGHRYLVSIDEHGARFPTHAAVRAPGIFRILCVGGSTVYGAAVDDDQTIPAALERRLNAPAPAARRYEAWNFGTSAYTLRQAAHLARTRLDTLKPDLVLVQLHNQGRRAFLIPPSFHALDYPWPEIVADPDLFEEQVEVRHWLPSVFAVPLLRHSAFIRASTAALSGFEPNSRGCRFCDAMDQAEARALSQQAEARGTAVVYYSIPANQARLNAASVFSGLPAERFLDLYQPNQEPAFYEVHPPPATLDIYARLLIEILRARGLVGPT